MFISAEVIYPELFSPRRFAGWFAIKEEDICFDALGIKQTGGKSQQGVNVTFVKQFSTHGLPGSAFKQHVVRNNNSRSAIGFE